MAEDRFAQDLIEAEYDEEEEEALEGDEDVSIHIVPQRCQADRY